MRWIRPPTCSTNGPARPYAPAPRTSPRRVWPRLSGLRPRGQAWAPRPPRHRPPLPFTWAVWPTGEYGVEDPPVANRRKNPMCANGLQTFTYHRDDPGPNLLAAAAAPAAAPGIARGPAFQPANLDHETVARYYINQLQGGGALPALATPDATAPTDSTDLKSIGSEGQPLTGTTTVKFYQRYHKIPIYGSLITVELDEPSHAFLAIHGALATPGALDSTARISPRQAEQVINQYGGTLTPMAAPPRLYYYFDPRPPTAWRLVYLAEDVAQRAAAIGPPDGTRPSALMDYVVDAHSGDFVAVLPRTQTSMAAAPRPLDPPPRLYSLFDGTANCWRLVYIAEDAASGAPTNATATGPVCYVVDARTNERVAALPPTQSYDDAWVPRLPAPTNGTAPILPPPAPAGPQVLEGYAVDGLGRQRPIRYFRDAAGQQRLDDQVRNVRTYDFSFRNYVADAAVLPGDWVGDPPDPWDPMAVSAHANAGAVADYFLTVLQRNGLDNQGGPYISSINCLWSAPGAPTAQEWANAIWHGGQMLYGQIRVDGSLRSYSVALDVVGHEITHGLTEQTARLEYQNQTGALNESYSDIFGVLIANYPHPDFAQWNWAIAAAM